MTITEKARLLKIESPVLASTPLALRNHALEEIAKALTAHSEEIFTANAHDLKRAEEQKLSGPVIKRLTFNESKLKGVLDGIASLVSLPDPLSRTLLKRELDTGLTLERISCPIGVIGVIFEARPDALVQISTLCLKSGNCAILKGGSETTETNRVLFDVIYEAAVKAGLPEGCLFLAEARSEIAELLECHDYVDLLIPRGSNSFVKYIMDNTSIPVMGHADGVCHVYVDGSADSAKALRIITDAKTQYVSVCNACETVLVDKSAAYRLLPDIFKALTDAHVTIRGNRALWDAAIAKGIVSNVPEGCLMDDGDYHTEYLDYTVSMKLTDDIDEAIRHINTFGSHHTDCIISEDEAKIDHFMQLVDSANVYCNCSTRFADGFRYGFGAEVGISTSKLHARGPVGLEGLVTYKYRLKGDGHIVADYAEGRSSFNFKDLI